MTTNLQGTRPSSRPGDATVVETIPTPVVTPAGVGGVAVYDRDVENALDPSRRPSGTLHADPVPVGTRPTGSILTWIIGAIVLIVLAYYLLQFLF